MHTVRLAGARHVVVGGRQVPAVHTSPGQQSFPSQGIPLPWHTHHEPVATPEVVQAMRPQHVFTPAPASTPPASRAPASTPASPVVAGRPQACAAGVQQRRVPALVVEHESPVQHSEFTAHPVLPYARQVGAGVSAAQRPPVQRRPLQHSVSSTHDAAAPWHPQRPVAASQSMYPQQSREVWQLPPARWQQRVCVGVGRQSKSPQQSSARAQVSPEGAQVAQRPLSQPSAPLHVPPAQQLCPSAPQEGAGARHTPD